MSLELRNVIMDIESGDGGLTYRYTYGLQKNSVTIYDIPNGAGSLLERQSYPNGAEDIVKLYYHHDHLGSTDYLTDNIAGKVTSYATYDDWGELTAKAIVKMGLRMLDLVQEYTGHPYDQVLGLYYAKARMYDAADRRFMAKDWAGSNLAFTQTFNQYAYVIDNPLKYIDPLGLYLKKLTGISINIEGVILCQVFFDSDTERIYVDFYEVSKAYVDEKVYGNINKYTIPSSDWNEYIEFEYFKDYVNSYYMTAQKYDSDIDNKKIGKAQSWKHYSNGNSFFVDFDYFAKIMCDLGFGKEWTISSGGTYISPYGAGTIATINSFFGYRNLSGGSDIHAGYDLLLQDDKTNGTPPVCSIATGIIREVQTANTGVYGRYVIVEYCDPSPEVGTFLVVYAHLSATVTVTKGTPVPPGLKIGNQGDSGGSQGNHLHFQAWKGNDITEKHKKGKAFNIIKDAYRIPMTNEAINTSGIFEVLDTGSQSNRAFLAKYGQEGDIKGGRTNQTVINDMINALNRKNNIQ